MVAIPSPKWFLDTKWKSFALFSEICPFGEEIKLSGMVLKPKVKPEVLLNTCEESWHRNRTILIESEAAVGGT